VGRFLRRLGVVALVAAALLGGYTYNRLSHLSYDRLTDDVFVIYGQGGNVGVLRTDAGTLVVDSMLMPLQGNKIRQLAEKLTGQPVRVVVNTHYHWDHTHGNPAFDADTEVVATTRTRENLLARDAKFWERDNAKGLPDTTFDHEHTIPIGGKTVRLIHPGRGHTDGDLVALFVEDRVLHTGDLVWNKRYPNIDLEAGGSIEQWIGTLDRLSALDFDMVIPGHGLVTEKKTVTTFQTFLRDLHAVGRDAAARGLTLEQTLAEPSLGAYADYEVMAVPFVLRLDHDFVVRRSWEEANGTFTYIPAGMSAVP
jgi:cyclase